MTPEDRLAELGRSLPPAPGPAASYTPWVISGDLVLTAGQIPLVDGAASATGIVGDTVDLETAQEAARVCALNVLAQLAVAADGLSGIEKLVKISVFVASAPGFTDQHLVANGASELLVAVLGDEVGVHARSAVGVAQLPLGVPVEVEAIARLRR